MSIMYCKSCSKPFKRVSDYNKHVQLAKKCQHLAPDIRALAREISDNSGPAQSSFQADHQFQDHLEDFDYEMHQELEDRRPNDQSQAMRPPVSHTANRPEQPTSRNRTRAEKDQQADEEPVVVEEYPGAAKVLGKEETTPMEDRYKVPRRRLHAYHPFASRSEWKLAYWMKTESVSDAAFQRFLNDKDEVYLTLFANDR